MKSKLFTYLSLVLLLGITIQSCQKSELEVEPTFSLAQPDQIPDENYEIYSLVIDENYNSQKVVIDQESQLAADISQIEYIIDYLDTNYPNMDSNLMAAYVSINENQVNFDEQFNSSNKEINLISTEEISYIFKGQDIQTSWNKFHSTYQNSGGLLRFSRIAFNQNNTQAIFEISHSYASLGGNGTVVYLEKENDIWVIKEFMISWVS